MQKSTYSVGLSKSIIFGMKVLFLPFIEYNEPYSQKLHRYVDTISPKSRT